MPAGIIFPLDCSDINQAVKYVELLKDHVSVFKIGLELFVNAGPEAIKAVSGAGGRSIFLDLKFHDIPETVRRALNSPYIKDVEFVTVHSCDGLNILSAAAKSVSARTKILGVTVLTSLAETEIKETLLIRGNISMLDLVLHRAKMVKDAGGAGVVCSGHEVSKIKELFGEDFITVVPGVRPLWSLVTGDDQSRIVTPRDAAIKGADYIVVGRPIRDAKDPVEAAKMIQAEMDDAGLQ